VAKKVIGELESPPGLRSSIRSGLAVELWPTDRYAAVARHLGEVGICRRWWFGRAQAERAMATRLPNAAGATFNIAPPTRFPSWPPLSPGELFIGSDTGRCTWRGGGEPCIGLYGPGRGSHGPMVPAAHRVAEDVLRGFARARRTARDLHGEHTTEMVCEACDRITMQGDRCK